MEAADFGTVPVLLFVSVEETCLPIQLLNTTKPDFAKVPLEPQGMTVQLLIKLGFARCNHEGYVVEFYLKIQ